MVVLVLVMILFRRVGHVVLVQFLLRVVLLSYKVGLLLVCRVLSVICLPGLIRCLLCIGGRVVLIG